MLSPDLVNGLSEILRVLVVLNGFILSIHNFLLPSVLRLYLLIIKFSGFVNQHIFILCLGVVIEQRILILSKVLEKVHVKFVIHLQIRMKNLHHPCVKIGLKDFSMLDQLVILETENAESTVEVVVFRRC